jgi:HSP20 family protein
MSKHQPQQLQVRIYQNENQFALAAPMPGLEPGDITVSIEGKLVTIRGKERGPHQHDLDLLKAEWSIGPYLREIVLPENVDGSLANATYGNGVLVVTLPKAGKTQKPGRTEFTLEEVQATRGEHVGHTGHDIVPTTNQEHRERLAQIPKRPAV